MFHVNEHHAGMSASYLFAEIARRVAAFREAHPQAEVISLGIGDVTRPLVPAVTAALHCAVDDMGEASRFHGYGPEQGYDFLREAIARHDYARRGVNVEPDEIFISDGSKSDVGNFQELFAADSIIAVTDPVYPVYVDSNAMSGRNGLWDGTRWGNIVYLPCTTENDFVPDFPDRVPDVIYLCYPNNPTGTVLHKAQLAAWVDYARRHGSIILYDAAYEAYISSPASAEKGAEKDADSVPHSIYEIEGAREVAVEFRSFSKTAGFTGLRCAFTVVPHELRGRAGRCPQSGKASLYALWNRRQCTKYNGCPYIVQRAAEAVYSKAGQAQVREVVDGYMENAHRMREALMSMGLAVTGGVHAPYLWVRTPLGVGSWEFFQHLLEKAHVVCTPGVGFGPSGEGYVRFTAFAAPDSTAAALERIAKEL